MQVDMEWTLVMLVLVLQETELQMPQMWRQMWCCRCCCVLLLPSLPVAFSLCSVHIVSV